MTSNFYYGSYYSTILVKLLILVIFYQRGVVSYVPLEITDLPSLKDNHTEGFSAAATVPIVLMHGMGDAAGNSGMTRLQHTISTKWNVYVANIAIGDTVADDTRNGFFMNLNDQVEIFAKKIQGDKNLANGFNAMGFSQGNLLIRAYIERYNNPKVHNFVSVHGPLMGVGALPRCSPTSVICKTINSIISKAAYSSTVQEKLAQANYYRDPFRLEEFRQHALFLPDLNNEATTRQTNESYITNFASLKKLILVRASADTMVFPKESEWFGAYKPNDYSVVIPMNQTAWYKSNAFGLRSLNDRNGIVFEETTGDHLQINHTVLYGWVNKYLV